MLIPSADSDERELQLYDPRRDSSALKAHPEQFEVLRGNYPLRREIWDFGKISIKPHKTIFKIQLNNESISFFG